MRLRARLISCGRPVKSEDQGCYTLAVQSVTCHQAQVREAKLLVVYLCAVLYQLIRHGLSCRIGRGQVQSLRVKGAIGPTEHGVACVYAVLCTVAGRDGWHS